MSEAVLRKWLGWGLIALVALMPIHAFISVYFGSLTHHQAIIASWKEFLILLLSLGTFTLLLLDRKAFKSLRRTSVYIALAYIITSLLVGLWSRPPLRFWLLGAKTNLTFIVVFLIGLVVSSRNLRSNLTKVIILTSSFIGLIGLIQVLLLPKDFLRHFGYSSATIQPYLSVGGTHLVRIVATLGGPNQLGSFLILPLCLITMLAIKRFRWWQPLSLFVMLFSLYHTYSRSAWIGAAIGIIITIILSLPSRQSLRVGLGIVVISLSLGMILLLNLNKQGGWQYLIRHASVQQDQTKRTSDSERLQAQKAGIDAIRAEPFGRGLGSAGPASIDSPHPLITENYYLQIAVEVGLIGLAWFITFMLALAWELFGLRGVSNAAAPVLGALIGISVVNLFLHGWADSSTALIFWTYAGVTLGATS